MLMQHDLIYTFFHPMLRDEQDFDKTNVLKLRGTIFHPCYLCVFVNYGDLAIAIEIVKV